MSKQIVDLRSDTVTKPSPEMLDYMMKAHPGDDVFGEDKPTNDLQDYAAALFGKEAALFCPSGTMTNQIALKVHTQPGDEIICEQGSHIYNYEGGGAAFNSGCQIRPLMGTYGLITAEQIEEVINPDDVHKAHTRLVEIENTSNRGGGSCYDFVEIKRIKALCDHHNLGTHLDGARLFNALVAKEEDPAEYGKNFDSISICLSKGLGAPIGSLLLGSHSFISKSRRVRKVFGGGMRQSGYLAAAGLYALQNNVGRLAEDHRHAKMIVQTLAGKEFIENIFPVETNIIIFGVKGKYTAASLAASLKEEGILVIPISKTQIRMVFHLDVSPQMAETVRQVLETL